MSDDLLELEAVAGALLQGLSAGGRRAAAKTVAVELRRSQAKRIAAQQNPDGSAYAPRKVREAKGRVRRRIKSGAMFKKLRTTAYMTADATAEGAAVGFKGPGPNRIACVHQLGLRDRVAPNPNAPTVKYPTRILLGFTEADRRRIAELVLEHLALRAAGAGRRG